MITEINPDIGKAVDKNGGYCCCATEKNADTLCQCKSFRVMKSGECDCGRYYKFLFGNGDDVWVSDRSSTFYGMKGTILTVGAYTPFLPVRYRVSLRDVSLSAWFTETELEIDSSARK